MVGGLHVRREEYIGVAVDVVRGVESGLRVDGGSDGAGDGVCSGLG